MRVVTADARAAFGPAPGSEHGSGRKTAGQPLAVLVGAGHPVVLVLRQAPILAMAPRTEFGRPQQPRRRHRPGVTARPEPAAPGVLDGSELDGGAAVQRVNLPRTVA